MASWETSGIVWDVARRIEAMDEMRIDVQLVSPTDVFYQYHQEPEVTEQIAREANEEIAGMVRDHPRRFMGARDAPHAGSEAGGGRDGTWDGRARAHRFHDG